MESEKGYIWRVGNVLRGSSLDRRESFAIVIAMCHAKKLLLDHGFHPENITDSFGGNLAQLVREHERDAQIAHFVSDVLDSKKYPGMDDRLSRTVFMELPGQAEELTSIILDIGLEQEWIGNSTYYQFTTPDSVADLAIELLDLGERDTLADFGAGTGSFMVKAVKHAGCRQVYGCDINSYAVEISKVRAAAMGCDVRIEQADMFHIEGEFDKCFSNYPFGLKQRGFAEDALYSLAEQGVIGLPKIASTDWLFNTQLVARLREGGRAIGVMTRGSAFNKADEQVRRHFVAQGWVEAVIALPEGIFSPYTKVATNMIVLSRGNDKVRFVDASEICQQGRRKATFSRDDIAEIARLLGEDADCLSCAKTYDDLVDDGFNLNPVRHLEKEIAVKNGASLESLSLNITRGAHLSKDELEALNSNEPTEFRYLELKNIVDGEIEDGLGYLTEIKPNQRRYCVADGDLLISKVGPNFKIAVAEVGEGETVLATANLYVVRMDRDKANPWYVKLYLQSDAGMTQLGRACVGTAQLNFPASGFANVMIPMIALDEQQSIVDKYMQLRQEITLHKLAIERAQNKVAGLLEGE